MSIETAIVARAQAHLISSRIQTLIQDEITKGCTPRVSPLPVQLEPRFHPVLDLFRQAGALPEPHLPEPPWDWSRWTRLRVWISPQQPFDWNRSELFLKLLAGVSHRVGFEIAGNQARIDLTLLLHRHDLPIVETAFVAEFLHCELMPARDAVMDRLDSPAWSIAAFNDFYPPPPYFYLLSTFEELQTSPFEPLLCALHKLEPPTLGFYQCLFQPVDRSHNWHANVQLLQDMEYAVKLQSGFGTQFAQQLPSGDLHDMAHDLECKAHDDKPFFAAAVRTGIAGGNGDASGQLRSLSTCMSLFQHGGRHLCCLGQSEYQKAPEVVGDMLHKGLIYRPGFLVNSRELAGLVHVFPTSLVEERPIQFETLETLTVKNPQLLTGTRIGICRHGDQEQPVCIPPGTRARGTHIVAASGMGKSTVMKHMVFQDILDGKGATFIDAHGDAIQHLLSVIPPEHEPRCICFQPGHPQWIPAWNPLLIPPGAELHRSMDDFLSAFERVSNDWGDRLAHVLRNGLLGLSHLPRPTLLDLYHLVRQKSVESDELRTRIARLAVDEPVRAFWDRDFLKDYRESDLASPKHKLHRLVAGGPVSLMLSQPESRIQFRQIMDEGKVLLVDLSAVGGGTREVLGSFMLTLIMMAALTRYDTQESARRPFSVYADEAHLFVSADAIESIITQTRKFGVSLCIAHQYLKQFRNQQVDALSTVGTTILGRLDKRDGQYFAKDLQDLVEPEELSRLEQYEMIARIDTDVVRMHTARFNAPVNEEVGRRILERSRRDYCLPADEVRRLIASRSARLTENFGPMNPSACPYSAEDLAYDEF